jgi:hypothetical protein
VQQLTELIQAAGHTDFRDARGPLGLNQRQAGGRFTRDEADALIARLEAEAEQSEAGQSEAGQSEGEQPEGAIADAPERGTASPSARAPSPRVPTVDRRHTALVNRLPELPAEVLAAELQRRGWVVMEP